MELEHDEFYPLYFVTKKTKKLFSKEELAQIRHAFNAFCDAQELIASKSIDADKPAISIFRMYKEK